MARHSAAITAGRTRRGRSGLATATTILQSFEDFELEGCTSTKPKGAPRSSPTSGATHFALSTPEGGIASSARQRRDRVIGGTCAHAPTAASGTGRAAGHVRAGRGNWGRLRRPKTISPEKAGIGLVSRARRGKWNFPGDLHLSQQTTGQAGIFTRARPVKLPLNRSFHRRHRHRGAGRPARTRRMLAGKERSSRARNLDGCTPRPNGKLPEGDDTPASTSTWSSRPIEEVDSQVYDERPCHRILGHTGRPCRTNGCGSPRKKKQPLVAVPLLLTTRRGP